ncbi:MAG: FAD-binding oxidoreductase [Gammaproteobacteria bacterium]
MIADDRLKLALAEWASGLSPEHVISVEDALDRYARSSSASSRRPAAVLKPARTDEVAAIVKIARRHRIPLYPISTGLNWGYGDACAVFPGQVIVDLGRMNRILSIDRELGYAVIEPGVTQAQLAGALARENAPFWMDCTGASPYSSLIGNILERGFGHTPYGNRLLTVSGLEVVLGTGEVVQTGFGHFAEAKAAHVFPYGVGPYIDGLFTQSNFGIVTRAGLWLLPKPEAFRPFLCFFAEDEDFLRCLEPLRELRMQRVLQSVAHVANDLRAISGERSFPRDLVSAGARLPEGVRLDLRRVYGVGAWTLTGALYGPAAQVRIQERLLKRAVSIGRARVIVLSERRLRLVERFAPAIERSGLFPGLSPKLRGARSLAGLLSGQPTSAFLKGSYWRRREGIPRDLSEASDPAADGCGILWLTAVLPFQRTDVERLLQGLDEVFARHGFDLLATLSMINERALVAIVTVAFDAADAAEAERARDCYRTGLQRALDLGYPPYRVTIDGMDLLSQGHDDAFWTAAEALKRALDPDGIIAPGRYQPSAARAVSAPGNGP